MGHLFYLLVFLYHNMSKRVGPLYHVRSNVEFLYLPHQNKTQNRETGTENQAQPSH